MTRCKTLKVTILRKLNVKKVPWTWYWLLRYLMTVCLASFEFLQNFCWKRSKIFHRLDKNHKKTSLFVKLLGVILSVYWIYLFFVIFSKYSNLEMMMHKILVGHSWELNWCSWVCRSSLLTTTYWYTCW